MPIASRSDIEIAQRACVMAGLEKIADFGDENETARSLNEFYEDIVEDCLTIHPWRFATLTVPLGPPLSLLPAVPSVGFTRAYALPNDPAPLQVRTLYVGGALASRYRIYGQQIWVDATPTDALELEALWRLPEAQWPPWFRLYAILRVAGFLSGAITRNGELAKTLLDEAEKQLVRARHRDSVQQTTQKLMMRKIRSSRLGGRPM